VATLAYDDVALADQAVRERFLPGEPTRLDLLDEIAELRAAAAAQADVTQRSHPTTGPST